MKRIVFALLVIFIASNSFGQSRIPFDENLANNLKPYLSHYRNPELREFIDQIYNGGDTTTICFIDVEDKNIDLKDIKQDIGIYRFYFMWIHPQISHVFLKYKENVFVLENDDNPETSLINQTEFLLRFFSEHPDVPKSLFTVYLKYIIKVDEINRMHIEF